MIMLVSDMHQQFLHWYDKQSNFSAPEVTPEEVDIYLNNAQYYFIKILTEQGLEKSQEWLDYLKNITTAYSTTPLPVAATNKPNGRYVNLPNTSPSALYRLALLEEVSITFTDCGASVTARVPVIPMTRDEYNKVVMNPFKKPWKEEIIRLVSDNNRFELIAFPGCTINAYFLDYLREPAKITYGSQYSVPVPNVNCELESKAATKVVEIAVELALRTMGDSRLQLEQLDKIIKTI
jgi:hypothetical protein